jgi:nicotinamidase-related amidase
MAVTSLDPKSALVLIDLQVGITALPTIHPADEVVARSALLAAAFRERDLPVALVNTSFAADGGDLLKPRTDAAAPAMTIGPDFADLRPELGAAATDILITKHQWDAFFGTGLDLQLRRRGVTQIVLAGISTSIGVESTARQAYSLGYQLAIATDAVTDIVATAHDNALTTIFPRIAELDSTDAILAAFA